MSPGIAYCLPQSMNEAMKAKDSLKMVHTLSYKNSYSWLVSEKLSLLFQLFFLSHH